MIKLFRSFAFALNGLKICFTSETNFKIHLLLTIIAVLFGIGFNITHTEWLAVIFSVALITALEMMNTAIEQLCNVVKPGYSERIKKVKDVAAGAVLAASFCSVVTGGVIFLPKIIHFIKSI